MIACDSTIFKGIQYYVINGENLIQIDIFFDYLFFQKSDQTIGTIAGKWKIIK
jgi:hypothetical protein